MRFVCDACQDITNIEDDRMEIQGEKLMVYSRKLISEAIFSRSIAVCSKSIGPAPPSVPGKSGMPAAALRRSRGI